MSSSDSTPLANARILEQEVLAVPLSEVAKSAQGYALRAHAQQARTRYSDDEV